VLNTAFGGGLEVAKSYGDSIRKLVLFVFKTVVGEI
jgi:hypothetical protein